MSGISLDQTSGSACVLVALAVPVTVAVPPMREHTPVLLIFAAIILSGLLAGVGRSGWCGMMARALRQLIPVTTDQGLSPWILKRNTSGVK